AGTTSASAADLAEGVLRGMAVGRGKVVLSLVLALGLLAAGAGLADRPAPAARPADGQRPAPAGRLDPQGDPLPAGALARLGTTRLRHGGTVRAVKFSPDGKLL